MLVHCVYKQSSIIIFNLQQRYAFMCIHVHVYLYGSIMYTFMHCLCFETVSKVFFEVFSEGAT